MVLDKRKLKSGASIPTKMSTGCSVQRSIKPSRTANSIHVMKMCQAFADNGHEVVLLAPNRYKEYENGVDDVYEYYGVRKNFEIQKLSYTYTRVLRNFYYAYHVLKEIKNTLYLSITKK